MPERDSLLEMLDILTADSRPVVYVQTYVDADENYRLRLYCPVLDYEMNMPQRLGESVVRKNFEVQAKSNSSVLASRADKGEKFTADQVAISKEINARDSLEEYFEYRKTTERENALLLLKLPLY